MAEPLVGRYAWRTTLKKLFMFGVCVVFMFGLVGYQESCMTWTGLLSGEGLGAGLDERKQAFAMIASAPACFLPVFAALAALAAS